MLIECYLLFDQNSSFIHYFKWQKFEFKQLIDNVIIDILLSQNFANIENI